MVISVLMLLHIEMGVFLPKMAKIERKMSISMMETRCAWNVRKNHTFLKVTNGRFRLRMIRVFFTVMNAHGSFGCSFVALVTVSSEEILRIWMGLLWRKGRSKL